MSPIALESIYDDILLPRYRKPATLAALRGGWAKRIQQETLKMELWSSKRRDRENREEKRVAMADDMKSPEYLEFLEQQLPKLQWEMEVDMFRYGDEGGASLRMLAHLEKYITHPSYREWSDQFKKLIKPEVATPAVVAPTGPKAAEGTAP